MSMVAVSAQWISNQKADSIGGFLRSALEADEEDKYNIFCHNGVFGTI
jgi:hypothetical protein